MIYKNNKYTKWYDRIIVAAQIRAQDKKSAKALLGYVEKHHIIPESFFINRVRKGPAGWLDGNPNNLTNLVYLTAREHFVCHNLLLHMCEDRALKIVSYAFRGMCKWKSNSQDRERRSARWYEKSKKFVNSQPVSEETRIKLSNANKGKITSEETKRKISESKKGVKRSAEFCAKMSDIQKNRPQEITDKITEKARSAERRKRSSEVHKGKIMSAETREKLSIAHKGKKLNDDQRAALSLALTGRIVSNESREKSSASNKGQKRSDDAKIAIKEGIRKAREEGRPRKKRQPLTEEQKSKMSLAQKNRKKKD